MNKNEVLKAIEICTSAQGCLDCPCFGKSIENCINLLLLDARDLIVDQEATILSLKKNGTITYQIKLDEEKMERIKNECLMRIDYNVKEIRADAIKTFAEKMKGIIPEIDDTYIERIVEDYIEKTVKEMTEAQNATHNNGND